MCIACIRIAEEIKEPFDKILFIDAICSQKKYWGCGSVLMNTIKYLASLLNCSKIRLHSTGAADSFYKKSGFEEDNYKFSTHYYDVKEDPINSEFKPFNYTIEGEVSLDPSVISNKDIYLKSYEPSGGKSTRRKRKSKKEKKNQNLKEKNQNLKEKSVKKLIKK